MEKPQSPRELAGVWLFSIRTEDPKKSPRAASGMNRNDFRPDTAIESAGAHPFAADCTASPTS
jgi:hypothetical protein